MAEGKVSWIVICLGIARAILHDRAMRRRFIGRLLMVALAMMAIGLWLINGWLQADLLRFALWWAACGVLTILVLMFACYDALRVIREERDNIDR